MKVSVIGVGAVGGFIATKLQHHTSNSVQLVVKPNSPILLDPHLHLNNGEQPVSVSFENVTADLQDVDGDVIFMTTKSTSNLDIFRALSHLQHKTFILLQNGIGAESQLARYVDKTNTIIGAISHIKVSFDREHHRVNCHNQLFNCVYADASGDSSPDVLEPLLSHIFDDVQKKENIFAARFPKLMVSISCNAASLLFDACMHQLYQRKECRELILALSHEVITVAAKFGVTLSIEDIENILQLFEAPQYQGVYFSMKEDHDKGLALEVDGIYRSFIDLSRQVKVQVPETKKVLERLLQLNTRLSCST
ncbi:ketopantoate reductase family protein [Algicola sagamiensis]|uniref:ketopantoate reductase family protein n=1 Tax=Algicola sagamiensis TaxID=163869 RepID=UPI0003660EF6|nr:ketopantoate reductase C-terminal domain-containing protein [Algicola sagamiensis]